MLRISFHLNKKKLSIRWTRPEYCFKISLGLEVDLGDFPLTTMICMRLITPIQSIKLILGFHFIVFSLQLLKRSYKQESKH